MTEEDIHKTFHFIEDDPFQRLISNRRKSGTKRSPLTMLIFALFVAYAPLIVISAMEGTFNSRGSDVPLVRDVALHLRFLLAVPILILSRPVVQRSTSAVCEYTYNVLLCEEDREHVFLPAVKRVRHHNESWTSLVVILVLVIGVSFFLHISSVEDPSVISLRGWFGAPDSGGFKVSSTYIWYSTISMSLFRFLLLKWLWTYCGWIWLLIKIAGCKLNLTPHHSDKVCGLNLLVFPQNGFNLLFVALAITSSGAFINRMLYRHASFEFILLEIGILVAASFVMLLGPYLFFMPKLFAARRLANFSMATKSHQLSADYDREWIQTKVTGNADEKPDPSVMIDFYSTYEITEKIRPLVFNVRDLVALAVPIALAFLPTLLTKMSLKELLEIILRFIV